MYCRHTSTSFYAKGQTAKMFLIHFNFVLMNIFLLELEESIMCILTEKRPKFIICLVVCGLIFKKKLLQVN